jgi:hypothetical protein
MKNFIYVCVITIFSFQTHTYAQNIHLPGDSVTKLLCKKWQVDYAFTEGKKLTIPPAAFEVSVEFYKDGTFSVAGGVPNAIEKGTWEYDAQKGTIFMIIVGKGRKNIISLTGDQFVIFADDAVPVPNDSLKIKVYFKVKQ